MSDVHLVSYINTHLGGSLKAINMLSQLCRREITLELYRFFMRLRIEMSEDQKSIKELLSGLGEKPGHEIQRERIPFPEHTAPQDFTRAERDPEEEELLEALEWLTLEIQSKALLWRSLAAVSSTVPSWRKVDFKSLEQRAKNQRDRTESVRMEMACGILRAD